MSLDRVSLVDGFIQGVEMTELLANTIEMIKPLDGGAIAEARARQDILTKPPGSLGRLEELSIQVAGIRGQVIPEIKDKAIIVMAGDHGVVAENIGNWPQEVTAQMVYNFLRGGAGINVIARQVGALLHFITQIQFEVIVFLPGILGK